MSETKSTNTKAARGRPPTTDAATLRDLAMNAYWQSDPNDVSVNAICQMAGVAKPSLYRLFGNEDGLKAAGLQRYAETVLADVFTILDSDQLRPTLIALADFACEDPRMETGCLFFKMRAGKHRLGPKTQSMVDEIDKAATKGFADFLRRCRQAGTMDDRLPLPDTAFYLKEQVALAITLRAGGIAPGQIRTMLDLAFRALIC